MYEIYEPVTAVPRPAGRDERRPPTADVLCYGTFQLRCAMDLLGRHGQPLKRADLEMNIEPDLQMVDAASPTIR